jgi:chemotaxis protein MotB
MGGRLRARPPIGGAGRDRWIISYADFITLLFAFFTTMYAASTVDAQKLARLVPALQNAFAATPDAAGGADRGPTASGALPRAGTPKPLVARTPDAPIERIRLDLANRLGREIAGGRVELRIDARGLVISIPESASFAIASADLSAEARETISQVAASFRDTGNAIRIEGHTDDRPIQTARFGSNWELSTARAINVNTLLTHDLGVPPERLSAAGYGEFHPRAPNDTDLNRARNRRVDMIVLNAGTSQAEEPGQ